MDKSEVLKARVSEELHRDFTEVCFALGRSPAVQLRTLIETFVAGQRQLTEDDVHILVDQPERYMGGAYRARITLQARDAMDFQGIPIAFALPQLAKRRVHPDTGFAVATSGWNGKGSGLDGVFKDGVWEGHIYSNGVAEEDNPTSIDEVVDELRTEIKKRIAAFRN